MTKPIIPKATRADVLCAVDAERERQDQQWGRLGVRQRNIPTWIVIIEARLENAKQALADDPEAALAQIRRVAATAVAALEQHGCGNLAPPASATKKIPARVLT